jgi:hypothetical protein
VYLIRRLFKCIWYAYYLRVSGSHVKCICSSHNLHNTIIIYSYIREVWGGIFFFVERSSCNDFLWLNVPGILIHEMCSQIGTSYYYVQIHYMPLLKHNVKALICDNIVHVLVYCLKINTKKCLFYFILLHYYNYCLSLRIKRKLITWLLWWLIWNTFAYRVVASDSTTKAKRRVVALHAKQRVVVRHVIAMSHCRSVQIEGFAICIYIYLCIYNWHRAARQRAVWRALLATEWQDDSATTRPFGPFR